MAPRNSVGLQKTQERVTNLMTESFCFFFLPLHFFECRGLERDGMYPPRAAVGVAGDRVIGPTVHTKTYMKPICFAVFTININNHTWSYFTMVLRSSTVLVPEYISAPKMWSVRPFLNRP